MFQTYVLQVFLNACFKRFASDNAGRAQACLLSLDRILLALGSGRLESARNRHCVGVLTWEYMCMAGWGSDAET